MLAECEPEETIQANARLTAEQDRSDNRQRLCETIIRYDPSNMWIGMSL